MGRPTSYVDVDGTPESTLDLLGVSGTEYSGSGVYFRRTADGKYRRVCSDGTPIEWSQRFSCWIVPDSAPHPQPPAQSTDWTCPACGKVNLREQRACGAGEWDGCGGPRVENEMLKRPAERTVNMIDDHIVYCNGLPITGAVAVHVDTAGKTVTITTDGMGQSPEWIKANTSSGECLFIDIDIVGAFRKTEHLQGYVQRLTENKVVLAISGHYSHKPRNYYMEITGAESMQEQFEEIVEKVMGEHWKEGCRFLRRRP